MPAEQTKVQPSPEAAQQSEAFADRLFQASLGMFDVLSVYVGTRLGYYSSLATSGPATPPELAQRTSTNERCVREWLEQQAVTGILDVEDANAEAANRRFALPPAHAEVLLDRDSLNYMSPVALMQAGIAGRLPAILGAYRTGQGVPYETYGRDAIEGQAEINRPLLLHVLTEEWLPAIPDVHARLQADPPARVADIGSGAGWLSIGIARAYPKALVDGFDLDAASVAMANENLRGTGLADRATFEVRDASDASLAGRYDLVTACETIHDLSRPVEVLRNMRNLASDGGAVVIIEERVRDEFEASADDVERLMYGWSCFWCLPSGMAEQPSAATGTVMRAPTLRAYAKEAGFREVEILPLDHPMLRLYRLHP